MTFHVDPGEGYILGDFLRKLAIRGSKTRAIAAFKVGSRGSNLGLSESSTMNFLDLLATRLVCDAGTYEPQPGAKPEAMKVHFTWDGTHYSADGFHIEGLPRRFGDSIQTIVVESFGVRSEEENLELVRDLVGSEFNDYVIMATKHCASGAFRYAIETTADGVETLSIQADDEVVLRAIKSAQLAIARISS